jgi:hypothetical protein
MSAEATSAGSSNSSEERGSGRLAASGCVSDDIFSLDPIDGLSDDTSSMSEIVGAFSDGTGSAAGADDTVSEGMSIFSLDSDSDSHCAIHTDGCFHAEDAEALLSRYDDVAVVPDTDFFKEGFVSGEQFSTVVVYSCEGRSDFPDQTVVREDGVEMELRFVSGRELSKTESSEFAFMRHGGGALTNWWIQKREGSACSQESVEHLFLRGGQRWHFAVYVRESSMSVERCRDLMLNSMGVQQHVRCREHDLPLVTAPFRSEQSNRVCCSGSADEQCSGRLMCCCPVQGCAVALCLKHKGKIYNEEDTVHLLTSHGGENDLTGMTEP